MHAPVLSGDVLPHCPPRNERGSASASAEATLPKANRLYLHIKGEVTVTLFPNARSSSNSLLQSYRLRKRTGRMRCPTRYSILGELTTLEAVIVPLIPIEGLNVAHLTEMVAHVPVGNGDPVGQGAILSPRQLYRIVEVF